MAGCLVPEVGCDRCTARQQADGETTLQGLRRRLRGSSWARRWRAGVLVDLCPDCDDTPTRHERCEVPGQLTLDDAHEPEEGLT